MALLFTDIEGSTSLLDRLGDRYPELLARHHQVLRAAIQATGGHEVGTAGDSFFVAFANSDDALECAGRAQRGLASSLWPGGESVHVRMGIHTGAPVVRDGSYVGMDVHCAARVMAVAHGRQVLVTDATREALRQTTDLLDLGPHRLKDIPGPVHLFQLLGAELPSDFPPLRTIDNWDLPARPLEFLRREAMQFVGRAAELERLKRLWEQAQQGTLLTLVGGDAGVGKTRFAYELCRAVHEEGAVVLLGHCSEETLTPYQPVVEALSSYVSRCPPGELSLQVAGAPSELIRLLPQLGDRLPELRAPTTRDPDSDRYRLFEAVSILLDRAAQTRPLLLLLEDIHWADASTLLMIRHIARACRRGGILLLATYRERELDESSPLAQAIADLRRAELVEKVSLKGLVEGDINELLTSWAGHDVPKAFVTEIFSQTEGNPLFVRETLRHLAETGLLSRENGRWSLDRPLCELGIPEGVRAVISSRLAHLGESPRRMLTLAAAMGREFSLAAIELAGELSDLDAVDLLDDALAAGLIDEDPRSPGLYRFSHALIRETLYQSLSGARRARIHRRLGEALECLTPASSSGPQLVELAHHFFAARSAGTAEKAVDYSKRAGDWSQQRFAYEEAIAHYHCAIEALELGAPGDDRRHCELLLALGEAQSKAGEFTVAKNTFWQAAELAEQLQAWQAVAQAALGVCGPFVSYGLVDEGLIGLLEGALCELPKEDVVLRSRVMGALAEELAFAPRKLERETLAAEALRLALTCNSKAALAEVLHHVAWATWSPDNLAERLELSAKITELINAGFPEVIGQSTFALHEEGWRTCCLLETGDRKSVDQEVANRVRRADELQQPFTIWLATAHQTVLALVDGRLDEAEKLAQHAFSLAPDADNAVVVFGVQLLLHRREAGRLSELTESVEGFVEQYPSVPAWRAVLADVYAEVGRLDDARRELDRLAENDFGSLPRDMGWLTAMFFCSEVCGFLDESDHARVLYELVWPYEAQCVVAAPTVGFLGSVAHSLGILAGVSGSYEDAAGHFDNAIEVNKNLRSPPLTARTEYCYARMLSKSERAGALEQADALARNAERTAKQLGMQSVATWASQLRSNRL